MSNWDSQDRHRQHRKEFLRHRQQTPKAERRAQDRAAFRAALDRRAAKDKLRGRQRSSPSSRKQRPHTTGSATPFGWPVAASRGRRERGWKAASTDITCSWSIGWGTS